MNHVADIKETINGPSVEMISADGTYAADFHEIWRLDTQKYIRGVVQVESISHYSGQTYYNFDVEARIIEVVGAVRSVEMISMTGNKVGAIQYDFEGVDIIIIEARVSPGFSIPNNHVHIFTQATIRGELRP